MVFEEPLFIVERLQQSNAAFRFSSTKRMILAPFLSLQN